MRAEHEIQVCWSYRDSNYEETGEQMLVDTSDDSFREEYCKITKKHETDLAKKLGKIGVGFAKVLSNEPYEIPLRKLFRYRMV